jgi:NAD(P)-dependent dehydrogenase (short-subunit alcohol dehydrogenase family)
MTHPLFDLTDKVALVTGGNGGLGLGFARGIAKCGGDVVIWGRSAEKNARAHAELTAFGGRVEAEQVDVTDEQAVIAGMRAAVDTMGRLDCVVVNAGITSVTSSMLDLGIAEFRSLMQINLEGGFFTLREGARQMVERAQAGDPGGSLVACGSLSAFRGVPSMPHYGAAKSAMAGLIRSAALEFAQYGIRANMVALGLATTDLLGRSMGAEVTSQMEDAYAQATPMLRVATPADVEGIAAYLASDSSAYHTGDVIVIDGGRAAAI